MIELLKEAILLAKSKGAHFAEARWVEHHERRIGVRSGRAVGSQDLKTAGLGIRCLLDGYWGFASTSVPSRDVLSSLIERSIEGARSSRLLGSGFPSPLPKTPTGKGSWTLPFKQDPMGVSLEYQLDMLVSIDTSMRRFPTTCGTQGSSWSWSRKEQLVNTLGGEFEQRWSGCGITYQVTACGDGRARQRQFGPWDFSGGWEHITALRPQSFARQLAQEAGVMLELKEPPRGTFDVLLSPKIMAALLHETLGHGLEADRVLRGAGVVPSDAWRGAIIASDIVHLSEDPTLLAGLGSRAFDAEGFTSRPWPLIKNGRVVGLMSDRKSAAALRLERSSRSARAPSPQRPPLVRMSNLVLTPGTQTFEELLSSIGDGIYLDGIIKRTFDAQSGVIELKCEMARLIKGGRMNVLFLGPTLRIHQRDLWMRCSALGDASTASLVSISNCFKGTPPLRIGTSHQVVPGIFRDVELV